MTVSTSTAPASETTTKEASNDDVVVEKKASAVVTPPSSTTDNKEQEKSTTDDSSTKATTVDKWNDAPSFSTSDDDWNAQFQAIWGNSTTSSSSESSNNNKEQMLQQTLHWMHRMVVDDLLPHAHQAMHREQQLLLQVQNLQDLLHDSQAALAQSQAAERKSQAALEVCNEFQFSVWYCVELEPTLVPFFLYIHTHSVLIRNKLSLFIYLLLFKTNTITNYHRNSITPSKRPPPKPVIKPTQSNKTRNSR